MISPRDTPLPFTLGVSARGRVRWGFPNHPRSIFSKTLRKNKLILRRNAKRWND